MKAPAFIVAVVAVVAIALCFTSCKMRKSSEKESELRCFYYWRTSLDFDKQDDRIAKKLGVQRLYVRLFDIDWSYGWNQMELKGRLRIESLARDSLASIIPCVYITNRSIEHCHDSDVSAFALRTAAQIEAYISAFKKQYLQNRYYRYLDSFHIGALEYGSPERKAGDSLVSSLLHRDTNNVAGICTEVQMDCDWTVKTKEKYFRFLQEIKKHISGRTLSCTLRLWQYRDRDKAGIPPVDRCMLMCYNVSNPKYDENANAIARPDIIAQYLKTKKYPVELDIALPVYSWAAMYKYGEFSQLREAMNEEDIARDTVNFQSEGNHRYRFLVDTLIGDSYYRTGDVFRIDQLTRQELAAVADVVKQNINIQPSTRIAFFSWDTTYINRYGISFLDSLYTSLRD